MTEETEEPQELKVNGVLLVKLERQVKRVHRDPQGPKEIRERKV